MAIFKCKMCGGELDVDDKSTVVTCDYCGTKQTIPTSNDEEILNLFNRANTMRLRCDFDKAEQLYERIISKDNKQAEAYWGVLLCKYGIEYVVDPKTGNRVPTCHRTSFDAITADEYYKLALDNADSVQRGIYEGEAKYIDGVQKEILAISQKEEPYDVFICYKESDESGKRTQDSVIANDIYYQLTQEGYKVFYAAITLEDKLGSAYEPIIFAALNSAKVMLAIGTKTEYFTAVWVKNEWSRYLKLMQKDRTKMLIPCYKGIDPYDLPEEFAHLQAQDMGKIGFINDLVRGIKKVIVKTKPEQKTTISTPAPAVSGNIANLLKRAYMHAEDGDFDSADDYAEKVLNIDSECAEAYVVKLMCNLKVKKKYEIPNSTKAFNNNSNYLKAMRFGDENLIKKLKLYKIDYAITEKEKSINERKATIDRLNNEINKFDKENDCINKKYKKAVVGAIAHMICTFLLVILVFSFRFPSLFSFSYLLIGTDLYYFVLISTMLASIVIKIVGINAMLKNSFTRVYKHAAIKSLREEIAVIENLNENAYKTAEAV